MAELPPDLDRLLVIEAHLRRQQAENATLATYLEMQLNAVRRAIAQAQEPAPAPETVAEIKNWRDRTRK